MLHPLRLAPALLTAALAYSAFGQGYNYQILFRSGQSIGGYTLTFLGNSRPIINNDGTVVFYANEASATGGIYTPTAKIVREGDTVAGRTIQNLNNLVDLNNKGQIAFTATGGIFWMNVANPASASFLGNGASVGGQVLASAPALLTGALELTDAGTAFFRAPTTTSASLTTLFIGKSSGGNLAVFPTSSFANQANVRPTFFGTVSRNGGSYAFTASTSSGNQVLAQTPGGQRQVVRVGDVAGGRTITSVPVQYAVNNSGAIVYNASYIGPNSQAASLIVTDSGVLADSQNGHLGKALTSLGQPRINELGQIIFLGARNTSLTSYTALFTPTTIVVETGQSVAASFQLTSVGQGSLNDRGQVAFSGESGSLNGAIIVASPAANCAVDLSAQLSIQRGGFRYNYATGYMEQIIRITNSTTSSLSGSFVFVLEGLTPGVTLANATGSSTCGYGGPTTSIGAPILAPGASATTTLNFANHSQSAIQYNLRTYGQ